MQEIIDDLPGCFDIFPWHEKYEIMIESFFYKHFISIIFILRSFSKDLLGSVSENNSDRRFFTIQGFSGFEDYIRLFPRAIEFQMNTNIGLSARIRGNTRLIQVSSILSEDDIMVGVY